MSERTASRHELCAWSGWGGGELAVWRSLNRAQGVAARAVCVVRLGRGASWRCGARTTAPKAWRHELCAWSRWGAGDLAVWRSHNRGGASCVRGQAGEGGELAVWRSQGRGAFEAWCSTRVPERRWCWCGARGVARGFLGLRWWIGRRLRLAAARLSEGLRPSGSRSVCGGLCVARAVFERDHSSCRWGLCCCEGRPFIGQCRVELRVMEKNSATDHVRCVVPERNGDAFFCANDDSA
jgi:hypothetical protein